MDKKIVLKRKIYNKLAEWKEKYAPDYALFLKGARRVGKTTIAEEFGENEYKSFITINFQRANDAIKDLFVNGLMDLDYFFNVIQMQYKTKLYPRGLSVQMDTKNSKSELKQSNQCKAKPRKHYRFSAFNVF